MTPGEASKQGNPIEIDHPIGLQRYPAQLFNLPEGIAWIEYGWVEGDTAGNPIHMVEGPVIKKNEDHWEISIPEGSVTIRILSTEDPADEVLINRMAAYRKGNRDRARNLIQEDLNLSIPTD